jgi:hypothetical protein
MNRNSRSRTFRPIDKVADIETGASLIIAHLDCEGIAITTEEIHLALRAECNGRRLSYFTNANQTGQRYVCVSGPNGKNLPVARWITGAAPNQQVRYKNGNRFDIRPENLVLIDRSRNAYIAKSREEKAKVFGPYDPERMASNMMASAKKMAKRLKRELSLESLAKA